ncbi:hypothetical protein PGT21_025787 [Puccinia graminis f. sp. tritici]|uniref:Uncharacterized protein n=1 Tax=Puccinia graminis f. sp. tritici TaxID=56615 RepID=A0A5B0M3L1_PUCGR|nr:hypothetical protein PGT21_025787 [Puccinia graminis f. sp. tritici]KAA1132607.1 hypothetical protein PGTUg99_013296 [Puccinia graminis f. sp. tritici]
MSSTFTNPSHRFFWLGMCILLLTHPGPTTIRAALVPASTLKPNQIVENGLDLGSQSSLCGPRVNTDLRLGSSHLPSVEGVRADIPDVEAGGNGKRKAPTQPRKKLMDPQLDPQELALSLAPPNAQVVSDVAQPKPDGASQLPAGVGSSTFPVRPGPNTSRPILNIAPHQSQPVPMRLVNVASPQDPQYQAIKAAAPAEKVTLAYNTPQRPGQNFLPNQHQHMSTYLANFGHPQNQAGSPAKKAKLAHNTRLPGQNLFPNQFKKLPSYLPNVANPQAPQYQVLKTGTSTKIVRLAHNNPQPVQNVFPHQFQATQAHLANGAHPQILQYQQARYDPNGMRYSHQTMQRIPQPGPEQYQAGPLNQVVRIGTPITNLNVLQSHPNAVQSQALYNMIQDQSKRIAQLGKRPITQAPVRKRQKKIPKGAAKLPEDLPLDRYMSDAESST